MDLDLTGKRALVCGSSQGIGRAISEELAGLGCEITLLARNEEKLRQLASELPEKSKARYIACDVANKEDLKEKVSKELQSHGPFAILINNSGGPPAGPIEFAKPEAFQKALDQHLFTNIMLSQLLLAGMKEAGFGRIVNIISTSVKAPLAGLGVSNTTRSAVANWAKTLSMEVASAGVTVNSVLPGATDTTRLSEIIANKAEKQNKSYETVEKKMLAEIPAGRFGDPKEVAAMAAFLCTKAAAYINGTAIAVDGGRTGCL